MLRGFSTSFPYGDDIIAKIYDRHLLRVGNPRLYDHPYHSPQQPLWEPGEVEWYVIMCTDPPVLRRKRRGRIVLIQSPLWANVSQG